MSKRSLLVLALGVSLKCEQCAHSFVVDSSCMNWQRNGSDSISLPAVRQPRRNLKKRKGRDRKNSNGKISDDWTAHDSSGEGWETKPLIAARRKEAGEDFWIDPKELQRENERRQAIANRIASEGEMPQEKLRSEVVAPYKQNWIGIISAFFVVLAIIAKSFPQAFELPSIGFPDLDAAGDPIPVQSTLANSARMTAERLIESIP